MVKHFKVNHCGSWWIWSGYCHKLSQPSGEDSGLAILPICRFRTCCGRITSTAYTSAFSAFEVYGTTETYWNPFISDTTATLFLCSSGTDDAHTRSWFAARKCGTIRIYFSISLQPFTIRSSAKIWRTAHRSYYPLIKIMILVNIRKCKIILKNQKFTFAAALAIKFEARLWARVILSFLICL